MAKNRIPEEWSRHLTPELRVHFDNVGEALVQNDVSNHNYRDQKKQWAALAWLAEQRDQRTRRDTIRFRLIFWTALATLIATLLAIAVTVALG